VLRGNVIEGSFQKLLLPVVGLQVPRVTCIIIWKIWISNFIWFSPSRTKPAYTYFRFFLSCTAAKYTHFVCSQNEWFFTPVPRK